MKSSNSKEKKQKKNSFSFVSPAKVNLFFEVLQKRRDGYHNITSLFHTVNWGDVLSFSPSCQDQFSSTLPSLKWEASNLIYQAVCLFRKETGFLQPFTIHLEKKIPIQAGLGGGSSNAATTLWALNELAGFPLQIETLQTLSLNLGSDVPFFFSSGAAICEGRGEKVYPLPQKMNLSFWIVKPEFGLGTQKVFSQFSFSEKEKPSSGFFNDLEKTAFRVEPRLFSFYQTLQKKAEQVVMTGSGSAFLVFQKDLPKEEFFFAQKVCTCTREENHWYLF